jgi:hypothetical protein
LTRDVLIAGELILRSLGQEGLLNFGSRKSANH